MAQFRLLGPVELVAGGRVLPVGPPQRCGVLAALAVDAGRQVPVDVLVDRVWGDEPPPGARRALQAHITRLRRLFDTWAGAEPVRLVRQAGGYLLDVEPERVDVHRLRRLVDQAREADRDDRRRAALLGEALRLWRGEPLAGLAGAWADRMRQVWRRERVDVLAAWARAELGTGDPGVVIGPLTDLVAEHPLLEPPAALLMRALHATGRTGEALDAYTSIRRRLVDELGTEPGTELREAHRTILRGDSSPPGPPPAPRDAGWVGPAQLPLDVPGFAGRRHQLDELDAVLAKAAGEPTAVVISAVSGSAGVGKTALAVHWAHRVADRFPDGQLFVNLRGFDPTGRAMGAAEAVRGFLDALQVPPHRIPAGLTAQIGLYRSLLAGRRMLIVLDNARDAEQVRPLLPGTPYCLVVVTSRNRLAGLVAAEGAHPVTVDLLPTGEARQLLAGRLGGDRVAAEPDAVDEIVARCARLPLALAIVAARAVTNPRLPAAALAGELRATQNSLDAFAGDDPATDVRAVFSWSYRTLSKPAARLFRLLGLHPGADLALPAAASLAGLPPGQAGPLLAELVRAHLLAEPGPGRYTFHDLLRAYAAELASTMDSDDQRDAALHRMLDHYLQAAHAANRMLLESHLEPIPLVPPRPGVAVLTFPAHQQAMAWFAAEHPGLLAVVELAAGTTAFHRYAWQLAWSMTTFFNRRAQWQVQAGLQRTGLDAARRLGDRAGQAHCHRGLGGAYTHLGRVAEAEAHLGEALAGYRALGDRNGQTSTHFGLSRLLGGQGRDREALDHVRQVLDLSRATGHLAGLANALNSAGWYQAKLGDGEQAIGSCEQAIALHQQVGNRFGEAATWDTLGYAHHRVGQYARAIACYRRALELNREVGDRYLDTEVLVHLGDAHDAGGDAAAARDAWRRALAILDELDHPDAARVRDRLSA